MPTRPSRRAACCGALLTLAVPLASLAAASPAAADADIGVALSARSGLLSPRVAYTLLAVDNGPDPVSAATIVIQLPRSASAVASDFCGYEPTTDVVTCATGAIASGDTAVLPVTVTYGVLALGRVDATAARAASSPSDPNPANDLATASCTAVTSLIVSC